jgi:hypothetical protein
MEKKKIIVLEGGVTPKQVATTMPCCKIGPKRMSSEEE